MKSRSCIFHLNYTILIFMDYNFWINLRKSSVSDPPNVEIKMTSPKSSIRQGDEMTLICNVTRSKPQPNSYSWFKNGTYIGWGQTYDVRMIEPGHSGVYTCDATNTVGAGTSPPFPIKVECKFHRSLHCMSIKHECITIESILKVIIFQTGHGKQEFPSLTLLKVWKLVTPSHSPVTLKPILSRSNTPGTVTNVAKNRLTLSGGCPRQLLITSYIWRVCKGKMKHVTSATPPTASIQGTIVSSYVYM